MAVRFYPRDKAGDAASFLKWISDQGSDAYFAVSSFAEAIANGTDKRGKLQFKGSRVRENAQNVRAFWVDIDVKREGDKKGSNVYAGRREAIAWVLAFVAATGMPRPNLWVNSGYGYHIYWVLEDALTIAEWQPYATALASAIKEHGFKCEAGLTSDAARILRPPGTTNQKGGLKAPVVALDKQSTGDYPNQLVLQALQPFLGQVPASSTVVAFPTGSPLAGGAPATAFAGVNQNMAAAAQANMPTSRHHSFEVVAQRCLQVSQSLAVGGAGDPYQLWYLGFLTLAHYCVDGPAKAHDISKGDPRYTPQATDAMMARIVTEQQRKDRGPPRCTSFDAWRGGICAGCPHQGKILGPWNLGADDGDLPDGYRRAFGKLQKLTKQGENIVYHDVLAGDVYAPFLDVRPRGGYALSFTHEFAGSKFPIRVDMPDLPSDSGALYQFFALQSLTVEHSRAATFRDFLVSFQQKLRDQRAERIETIPPFGYAVNAGGKHAGVAVAGTLYRADGTQTQAPGGDLKLITAYTPHGSLDKWKHAATVVTKDRVDLQLIVAANFGAPLMRFTGEKAMILNLWSRDSGLGKSSAMQIGQSIWSEPGVMNSLDDTPNAVNEKLAQTRFMPGNWDELRVKKDAMGAMVDTVFSFTQGKEKSRMGADTKLRDVRSWRTLIIVCGNTSLLSYVLATGEANDAGAVRILSYRMDHPRCPHDPSIARIVQDVEHNYGHAGRVFAQYVAENYEAVDALVVRVGALLGAALSPDGSERLFIAGMSAIIAGAALARKLGLVDFDVNGITETLKATFLEARKGRSKMIVNNGAMDCEQILSMFVSDYLDSKIFTNRFARRGPVGDFECVWVPKSLRKVEIQVSQIDKMMRINRATFNDWCRRKGYAPDEVLENFRRTLGATEAKRTIGQGTIHGGGQLWCIDVPLTTPSLEIHQYVAGQVVPLGKQAPAAALAGNQAKV